MSCVVNNAKYFIFLRVEVKFQVTAKENKLRVELLRR